jgi:16S rRNA (cytosine967-C5)-methyltransferase
MSQISGIGPRQAALRILQQVRDGDTFDLALNRAVSGLAEPDRRLAHELAAGVLRNRTTLDAQLAPMVPRGWSSVAPDLQDVLRLGLYQLTDLDRVPDHAAVNTSVTLARSAGGARSAAFVNAVLRRAARSEPTAKPASGDPAERLAVEHSHPVWLVRRWIAVFGQAGAEGLLRWNNSRPRLVLQPARADEATLATRWRASGLEVDAAPRQAGLISSLSRPAELPGFHEGDFIVQDPAQAMLARFANVPPNALVYDMCAAPGGKTIALGRSARTVIAGEVSPSRARRLAENLRRAGSGREFAVVADGRHPPLRSAEVVLIDAPCLGTGTFARHPDARWRVTSDALASLAKLQGELLDRAASVVLPGGLLVYSTCSVEPEENARQVNRFLAMHPAFRRVPSDTIDADLISEEGDLTILPHVHGMDGAYGARLRRVQ